MCRHCCSFEISEERNSTRGTACSHCELCMFERNKHTQIGGDTRMMSHNKKYLYNVISVETLTKHKSMVFYTVNAADVQCILPCNANYTKIKSAKTTVTTNEHYSSNKQASILFSLLFNCLMYPGVTVVAGQKS